MIEILLHVIIYPLALELFAFQSDRSGLLFQRKFAVEIDGPLRIEKGVAKTFSITIMRLPRWKRRLPQKRSVEVGLDYFDCVCGLLALINFA